MAYIVTHGKETRSIDRASDLDAALGLARLLIAEGDSNVTIHDGSGHKISGRELSACCSGHKKLTSDLWTN
jgi:hypothetical protein